jgi:type IV fimbrial biogenesis protein FimT
MPRRSRARYAAIDDSIEREEAMTARGPLLPGSKQPAGAAPGAIAVGRVAPGHVAAGPPRGRIGAVAGRGERAPGWTLVEVLVALAIAGLLSGFAMPAMRDWIAMQTMLNEARRLTDSLHLARSEAIKSGYRVNVCKSKDRLHCTKAGGWEAGYIVYADTSRDGSVDPDEPLVRVEGPAPAGISIRANHPLDSYVSFTSLGRARLLNGALQMGTFTLCRDGRRAYEIVLANSGRVRIDKATGICS